MANRFDQYPEHLPRACNPDWTVIEARNAAPAPSPQFALTRLTASVIRPLPLRIAVAPPSPRFIEAAREARPQRSNTRFGCVKT